MIIQGEIQVSPMTQHFIAIACFSGIVDSSGIEFFYTKQKPLYEAGALSIAQPIIPVMIIPPRDEFFWHTATCLSSCTDKVSILKN